MVRHTRYPWAVGQNVVIGYICLEVVDVRPDNRYSLFSNVSGYLYTFQEGILLAIRYLEPLSEDA